MKNSIPVFYTDAMVTSDLVIFLRALISPKRNIPLVLNLAGGYQVDEVAGLKTSMRKVLDLHGNTMKECAKVYL
jgi:hypothetical protein